MAVGAQLSGQGEDDMASDGGLRDPGEAALEGSMEVLELFPRYLLKGCLPTALLSNLQVMAAAVLADPDSHPDAAPKLAGQLSLQRELGPQQPAAAELCSTVILPACERWIRHVIDRQPQGRGPWTPGRYGLQMIDLWLNVQRGGDYNPAHTHGGSFSGVLYLKVPPQIRSDSFDGQLCLHGQRSGTSRASAPAWPTMCCPGLAITTCFRPGSPIRCRPSAVKASAGRSPSMWWRCRRREGWRSLPRCR